MEKRVVRQHGADIPTAIARLPKSYLALMGEFPLRMLVQQADMSTTELGELLGSKGAASELLSGKRKEPSKAQIARLCARFHVDAGLFLLPARLPANAA